MRLDSNRFSRWTYRLYDYRFYLKINAKMRFIMVFENINIDLQCQDTRTWQFFVLLLPSGLDPEIFLVLNINNHEIGTIKGKFESSRLVAVGLFINYKKLKAAKLECYTCHWFIQFFILVQSMPASASTFPFVFA